MTNIFSHAEMADKYHITYDNRALGDAFIVHTPVKSVTFERLANNLYVHKPKATPSGNQKSSRRHAVRHNSAGKQKFLHCTPI